MDTCFFQGLRYGIVCQTRVTLGDGVLPNYESLIPIHRVCDTAFDCVLGADEEECDVSVNTLHTCTHFFVNKKEIKNLTVPIFYHTRCAQFDFGKSMYPYCMDYLDQTNCSDLQRVGGICPVNAFMSNVSKHMVCYDYDHWTNLPVTLCDDGFQNLCTSPSTSQNCRVHKQKKRGWNK